MALMGEIAGMEDMNRNCEVDLYSDSKYVISAFNEHWIEGWLRKNWKKSDGKAVKNVELWKRLLQAAEPHTVTWHWVKGHDGHPENERCDTLATTAADADTSTLLHDDGKDLK
jgi:ribonuclease HI